MRVIKRYPNRKLYDTVEKEYITLKGIARLIQAGEEIHVVDNATGEDLTAVILTQVISDLEKEQSGFLPRSVLSDLIQAGGLRISALQRSLLSQMGFLRQVDEEIKRRIQHLVSRGDIPEHEANSLLERLLSAGGDLLNTKPLPNEAEIEKVLDKHNVPTRQDLEKILSQLDDLMTKLDDATSPGHPSSDADD
jgi:polyhydroxyalkanoate synthesis repressor PhaR